MHGNLINEIGNKYGMLEVISRKPNRNGSRLAIWLCKCDCGRFCERQSTSLRKSGEKNSCGCRLSKITISRNKSNARHGMFGTKIYSCWSHIKQRCEVPSHQAFRLYGAMGIKLYDPWSKDFVIFYNYVGDPPSPEHSLDRINNNGNYEPGNVRWATSKEQGNNRRNNVRITYKGETKTLTQWANSKNMNVQTLYARLNKYKWPLERAMNEKVKK